METIKKEITEEKANGRIYTPTYIVNNILDLSGYIGENILKKQVIDNSCGDGAFLCEVVNRYCRVAISQKYTSEELKKDLELFVHGIEIDRIEAKKCIANLTATSERFGINNVNWDIMNADTLTVTKFDNKMDFVVGNPPYVRVHNVGGSYNTIKKYSFAQTGMTDLYLVFYEIGINMLNEHGILGYITPSSFFNSVAGSSLRKKIIYDNLLQEIVDLKHFQPFNATTYTTIVILNKNKIAKNIKYDTFDDKKLLPIYEDTLSPNDFYLNGNFYFAKKGDLISLKKILYNTGHSKLEIKNGFATLCDKVFINNFNFESKYIIPVIKASTAQKKQIVYPYDSQNKLIPENALRQETILYNYLQSNKNLLEKRSNEGDKETKWYSFGRSQAISDTYKNKLALNTLVKTKRDVKITPAPLGVGVYSGLYILNNGESNEDIYNALVSDEFITYVSLLSKYKSGGYYTFSTKDVKMFLDYKLAYDGGLLL